MGFGWLFFGYFAATLLSLNSAGSIIRIFGYAIVIFAATRLRRYHKSFNYLLLSSILMTAVSALLASSVVGSFLYEQLIIDAPLFTDSINTVFSYIEMAGSLVFYASLLWSTWSIGRETGVEVVMGDSVRNAIFISLYNVILFVCAIPAEAVQTMVKNLALGMWGFLLYLTCVILNLILIFRCYAKICDENDTEMERKPSRFAFVNKFRAELDARQEKAMESTNKYVSDKIRNGRERANKRKRRK